MSRVRHNLALAVIAVICASCQGAIQSNASSADSTPAPAEDWVIVLRSQIDADVFSAALCAETNVLRQLHNYTCNSIFRTLLKGVSGTFSRAAIRDVQQRYKDSIDHVSRDRVLSVGDELVTAEERAQLAALLQQHQQQEEEASNSTSPNTTAGNVAASNSTRRAARLLPEQLDPVTWGLDRIDQAQLPLDNTYHYDNVGTGVHVYVIDSGIRATHQQFRVMSHSALAASPPPSRNPSSTPPKSSPAPPSSSPTPSTIPADTASRVTGGYSALPSDNGSTSPTATDDCFGHGTHVAALIGGLDNGVAKNVTLHPVKVLDCYGSAQESTLLQGLEWVASNLQYPALVHMSLEGYYSAAINAAVEDLVNRLGVLVVASAGNHNSDTCTVSPASAQSAIAVGAIDTDGSRWYNSNWGPCLDMFAPGVNIVSAVPWSDTSEYAKTGTSMAAPFVTGVAALYLDKNPGASPSDVTQRLLRSAKTGLITDDTSGMDTFTPSSAPSSSPSSPSTAGRLDISSTPNRLLQSVLTVPVRLLPSVVQVQMQEEFFLASSSPLSAVRANPVPASPLGVAIDVELLMRPTAQVNVTAQVPLAWNGDPLADVFPASLAFLPSDFNSSRRLQLQPNPAAAQGDYYVQLSMRSTDPRFDFAVQVFKVQDSRMQVGETTAVPRVIRSLPFSDAGNTLSFRHDYATSEDNPLDTAPDVVYSITPSQPMSVSISTCGSSYDTVLLLGPADLDLNDSLANDDDPSCGPSPPASSCSRIDQDLQSGVTYYILVSGFNGAAGNYKLDVWCQSCTDGVGRVAGGAAGVSPPT